MKMKNTEKVRRNRIINKIKKAGNRRMRRGENKKVRENRKSKEE
jgi:hypothetical protein